ncbi:MAG: hypothetical protein V2A76_10370 [Planctomycetota bacterium]
MLRVKDAADASRHPRSAERIHVALGEMKVACGEDVVFESEPLRRGFAFAVFDPVARIGGMIASVGDEEDGGTQDGSRAAFRDGHAALSTLVESLVHMGADRRRLSFAAAGDLSVASGAFQEEQPAGPAGKSRRRLRRLSRPMTLIMDLGIGVAQAVAAE